MEPFGAQKICADKRTLHCGYLKKYNPAGKAQKRYCIINFGAFLYYKEQNSGKPQGYFSLSGYVGEVGEGETQFLIKPLTDDPTKRTYTFKAFCKDDRDSWLRSLRDCVFRYFPESLHNENDEISEIYDPVSIYDYIQINHVMKAVPRKTGTSEREINPSFVGPTYSSHLTMNSNFVPEKPPEIPKRVYPPSCSKLEPTSTILNNNVGDNEHESDYISMAENNSSDIINGIERDSDGYISIENCEGFTRSPNSMEDHYESMTGESHYEDMTQHEDPDYIHPNIHLLFEQVIECSSEDDEDVDEESDFEQCQHLVDSCSAKENNKNSPNIEEHMSEKLRSMSVIDQSTQPAHKKVERLSTVPALPSRSKVESNEKRPIPAPRPRHLSYNTVSTKTTSKYDYLPESCFFKIAREDCLERLYRYPVGTYLIRTGRDDGKDAIAVLARESPPKVRHFIVFENQGEKYLAKEEQRFSELVKLIEHYFTQTLPLTDIKLIQPWKP